MRFRLVTHTRWFAVLASVAVLAWMVPSAQAQFRLFGGWRQNPCPPSPCCPPEVKPAPGTTPEPAPPPEQLRPPATAEQRPGATPGQAPAATPGQTPETAAQPPSLAEARFGAESGTEFALAIPNMQGHQLGIPAISFGRRGPQFPPVPGQGSGAVVVPTIRSFKIAEDESPRPQDRIYFGFNYYNNVNDAVNTRMQADVHHIDVYRETFGLEKTFLDERASVGLRLPLNTLTADSPISGLGGTNTALGDLSIILKYAFWWNRDTGSLASVGLGITPTTGPDAFAGSHSVTAFHSTTLQPYLGYIWNFERWYLHGFLALDVPTDSADVTLLYNDIGAGYYLYRNRECGKVLSAVIPTFEVHVNTPLNHRGAFNFSDLAGTPDWVELTMGTTFELYQRSTLAIGIVTPITGPKPYDFEVLAQLNIRF
jgi:hypothetical protein